MRNCEKLTLVTLLLFALLAGGLLSGVYAEEVAEPLYLTSILRQRGFMLGYQLLVEMPHVQAD